MEKSIQDEIVDFLNLMGDRKERRREITEYYVIHSPSNKYVVKYKRVEEGLDDKIEQESVEVDFFDVQLSPRYGILKYFVMRSSNGNLFVSQSEGSESPAANHYINSMPIQEKKYILEKVYPETRKLLVFGFKMEN